MKKLNKKGITPFIMLFFVLLILLLAVVVIATIVGEGVSIPGGDKKKVACDVHIHDSLLGQPEIESYVCQIEGSCLLAIQPLPLAVFSNKGFAMLTMGGKTVKQEYGTFKWTGDETLTLRICTMATTGTLKLTDEDSNTIDSKEVVV